MSDRTNNDEQFDRDDETMARLLRMAGTRSPIPEDVEARVYARVQDEWRAGSEQPESARVYAKVHRQWKKEKPRSWLRRLAMPVALAAAVVLTIAVVMQPSPPDAINVPVGTVARVTGDNGGGMLPAVGQPVYPGERLSTGPGQRMSLTLDNAASLRIDEQTVLLADAKDQFRLVQGRIYADSGDLMYRDRRLVISSSMGTVTDIGTQFSVAIAGDLIDVAVREGRVDLNRDGEQHIAVAGERLKVHRLDGATTDALAAHDTYWDWAIALAPNFDIENKSLLDFLRWAARETGRELVFESNELRMSAMRTDLHGSVSDFDILEAVESVLVTTNFKYRIETDRIVIEESAPNNR
jgi:ferric-dicitrate binding protein FerR (iron transport regulator)